MAKLHPFPGKTLADSQPLTIRPGELRPVLVDGFLVDMVPVKRCPTCHKPIGEDETACPEGAQKLPIQLPRRHR
jgi:hypothetical protein